MQNVKELKIGRYSVKIGKFPNGFRFNIFAHDRSLFGKGVEDTEENAIEAELSDLRGEIIKAEVTAKTD